MNKVLLDSSCWIEILTEGARLKSCKKALQNADEVIVPTLIMYEVYKKVLSSISEDQALSVISVLSQYQVVDLSRDIALAAADISINRKLPMADSLALAHAHHAEAVLVTLDNHFHGISGVQIIRK